MTAPAPELLTLAEAAARMAISVKSVRRLLAAGKLTAIRPTDGGRSIKIEPEDVERHIRESRCQSDEKDEDGKSGFSMPAVRLADLLGEPKRRRSGSSANCGSGSSVVPFPARAIPSKMP